MQQPSLRLYEGKTEQNMDVSMQQIRQPKSASTLNQNLSETKNNGIVYSYTAHS